MYKYLYTTHILFFSDYVNTAARFMELHATGVTVSGTDPVMPQIDINFNRNAVLNDGNWHHIVFNYAFNTGTVELYFDTVFQGDGSNINLIMINETYK